MSSTDIREALHSVGESTPVPVVDRLALQRKVAQERRAQRARWAGTATLAVAASVALVAVVGVPFTGGAATGPAAGERTVETTVPPAGRAAVLAMPVYYLLDGQLHALDPDGQDSDLGVVAEEIIGSTYEGVYVVDTESTVQRLDARPGDEGPEGRWTFRPGEAQVAGPVQSARLSADGRWLGWIDLEGRLVVRDLLADRTAGPRPLPVNSYLADLAQGTGAALVSQDGDLVLKGVDGEVPVPTAGDGYGWESSARADRVAVVDRDAITRVYDVATGAAVLVDEVPGSGHLSPYGDALVSVHAVRGSAEALIWRQGEEPEALPVPGRVVDVAWADDDTALVVSSVDGSTVVHACDVADRPCTLLPIGGDGLTLAH
ncbi:hypothetical protein I601_0477 [Nocardioides dokdonensis FR1436]|uniref:Uncharacterized protein n=1 Tax=Nocardioides dokdonensis FR1436 TaxID=1300347 RepID=A0A1A9GF10_9ACTN|nr:hypothetical protein [Nocardioides dokdonensis]ANH36929.1 hypothetical protein I601_0477 [Nocardioides dokdonensis FR1436]